MIRSAAVSRPGVRTPRAGRDRAGKGLERALQAASYRAWRWVHFNPLLSPDQVIDAMNLDSGVPLAMLKVDGGLTKSDVCMQTQANVLGITVGP